MHSLSRVARSRIAQAALTAISAVTASTAVTLAQATPAVEETTNRLVVRHKPTASIAAAAAARRDAAALSAERAQALGARAGIGMRALRRMATGHVVYQLARALPLSEARLAAKRLTLDPDVLSAEPDVRVHATALPSDPDAGSQWTLDRKPAGTGLGGADFLAAWPLVPAAAPRVPVAMLDTGVLPHPQLVPRLLAGHDFVADLDIAGDGDGRDADATDPGDACKGVPSTWHGLKTAGVIAAIAGDGIGIAGAAGNHVNIVPVRVLGRCGGFLSDTADGIGWATGASTEGAAVNATPARVLNVSLGAVTPCPNYMQAAIDLAASKDAVVVVAAGNDGADLSAPANCKGVVAVGAHTAAGDLAAYSNRGAGLTLTAPAGGACSVLEGTACDGQPIVTLGNRGTAGPEAYENVVYMTGTSVAAPHVAATVALMLAAQPNLSAGEIKSLLQSTARLHPNGTYCTQHVGDCGAGMLDARAALNAVSTVPVMLITSAPGNAVAGGANVTVGVTASGRDGPYTYRWTQLEGEPVTLTQTTSASLAFVAPMTHARSPAGLSFQVVVTAPHAEPATATLRVQVNNAPAATVADISATEGAALSAPLSTSDVDEDRVTLALLQGPSGLELNGSTLSWPAPRVGNYSVTVQADDAHGGTVTTTFKLSVTNKPVASTGAGGGGGGAMNPLWLLGLAAAVAGLRRKP